MSDLIAQHLEVEPTVSAYMIARAALRFVRRQWGPDRASELAAKIHDDLLRDDL